MICWMFPGQPLKFLPQPPQDSDFSEIAALCREKTGFDPAVCTAFSQKMTPSICMQVYGVAMSLYFSRIFRKNGKSPNVVTQHSMGIYPALAACGVITEADALEMTARAGICMSVMSSRNVYMLGCVIGLQTAALQPHLCRDGAYIANFNTSRHFLLSGLKTEIQPLLDTALAIGAFSVSSFDCDAPLHTPLMNEVSDGLRFIFSDYNYAEPAIPLISHCGVRLENTDQIRTFLHDELLLPVYWEKSYTVLKKLGVNSFLEIGSGDALKKFNRWIESEQENR